MRTIRGEVYYFGKEVAERFGIDKDKLFRAKQAGLVTPDYYYGEQTMYAVKNIPALVSRVNSLSEDAIKDALTQNAGITRCGQQRLFTPRYNKIYTTYRAAVARRVALLLDSQTPDVIYEREQVKKLLSTLKLQMRAYEVWDGNSVTVRAK